MTVAVLFVRADSHYKTMADVDAWDIERDASTWPGGMPAVCHPPCRAWGRFSHMAKQREGEKELARRAVAFVREWGGVLEHPLGSSLWADQGLPAPGARDSFGGWTMAICQHWFGHRAEKRTLLYVVGCEPQDAPIFPFKLGGASHVIAQGRQARPDLGRGRLKKGVPGWRPEVTPREREATPPDLARWLVDLAQRCAMKAEAAA